MAQSSRVLRQNGVVSAPKLFLVAFGFAVAASAQPNEQPQSQPSEQIWTATCSSKIEHPQFPLAALAIGLKGEVSAEISIVARKEKVATLRGPALFTDAVRTAIDNTTFPEPCSGRRLSVTFSFRVEPNSSAQPNVASCFSHPPNRFSVIASDTETICPHWVNEGVLLGPNGLVPITVCELLSNPFAYSGKNVALLGRLDDSHFDGAYLSEDNCTSRLVSGQHLWPDRVWIRDGMVGPDPPMGLLVLDPATLERKLAFLRSTTHLKMEELTVFTKNGTEVRSVQQPWAVIFGRIESREQLRPPSDGFPVRDWGNGFGQMNSAPAQIVSKQENEFYIRDNAPSK
jgi:hypothetical protein